MKWLSIKEYKPPACADILIRAELHNQCDRYFIARIENYERMDSFSEWQLANGFEFEGAFLQSYRVTHFCIIDATERNRND